ncbi:MAG: alginate lyase family protein [Planctomycetota bacterium]
MAETRVIVWEPAYLASVKQSLPSPTPEVERALTRLRDQADEALDRGPFSVMQKKELPPSGDKHDYLSYSRYWWPNPDTKDGLPFVRRDGETNVSMRAKGDRDQIGQLFIDVEALTLAHYFFDDQRYAQHARKLIKTWFLDPETKMNPNLNYAQAVLGRSEGRGVGIIDSRGSIVLLDCVALLCESNVMSKAEDEQLRAWYRDFLVWLRTSRLGKEEEGAKNNHGSWYAAQTARIAVYVDKTDIARKLVMHTKNRRIPDQFDSSGGQPYENERTKSLHYCFFNLSALTCVARVGEHVGVDLWKPDADGNGGLQRGLEFLRPYLQAQEEWPHRQMERFRLSPKIIQLLRMASVRYNDPKFAEVIDKTEHRHRDFNYSALVCDVRRDQPPQVTVVDSEDSASTPYDLPDLSNYTAEKIRSLVPHSGNGEAKIVSTAEIKLLEEAFRDERGTDLQERQGRQDTRIIEVCRGPMTVTQLVEQLNDTSVAEHSGSTATLRLPLLVSHGAALIIDGSETATLRLSTDCGAFVANAGDLYVVGANVVAWDEATNSPTVFQDEYAFRPYISSYVRSRTYLAESRFEHLGYHAPTAYGLSLSSHPERELGEPREDWPTGQIVDCVFTGLFYGFYSYEARDVAIVGNTYDNSIRYGIDPHDRSTRLIIANNTAKSTRERHGIIGSRGVSNSYIFNNKSFENEQSGIMLDRQCSDNVVVDNQVFKNGQGIAIYESSGNLVANNLIAVNEKSGVRVRNSTDLVVESNTVVGNGDYAFEVYSKTLADHNKRFSRGDRYRSYVEAIIRSNTATGNKGCVKGNRVQMLSLSDIRTEIDPTAITDTIPVTLAALDDSGDQEFGSQLKPYRNELRQAFETPRRVVEYRDN